MPIPLSLKKQNIVLSIAYKLYGLCKDERENVPTPLQWSIDKNIWVKNWENNMSKITTIVSQSGTDIFLQEITFSNHVGQYFIPLKI
jgi:hypothetical protein